MPIKDLSENVRMPRIGKIHLGIKHPEKGYPMKTDYFVFPKEHSDYKKLVELFGEKPKELRVLIPTENEEDWAPQYYKSYNQTYGLVCAGDGELAKRNIDTATGNLPDKNTKTVRMIEVECKGKDCPIYQSKKCGEVMNLRFMIPEIPGLGVWQIDTGSINSILNINSCARLIKKAFGRISMIPLKLTFEPCQVNNPEDGKKQTVYVMHLRTDVTMAQLADAAREQSKQFLLEPPDLEAAYDAKVDKDIEELWGDGKPEPVKVIEAKHEPEVKQQVPEPAQEQAPAQEKPGKGYRDPETIKNTSDLVKACCADWPLSFKSSKDVSKELGIESMSMLAIKASDAYRQIVQIRKQPEV